MDNENVTNTELPAISDPENPFAQFVQAAKRELQSEDGMAASVAALESRVKALEENSRPDRIIRPCDA